MAKGVYIGVDNKARKVKKMYIGVDGKARKVKKGYIGVGGVARPFFTADQKLVYYGTITAPSVSRSFPGHGSIGNYAVFAGGNKDLYTFHSSVDTYNKSLTKGTATALSKGRSNIANASIGNYILFAGGLVSASTSTAQAYSAVVDAYNSSLTRSVPTALSAARDHHVGTHNTAYALIAGGGNNQANLFTVDAYNSSLTRSAAGQLSERLYDGGATFVGGYALFAGGSAGSNKFSGVVSAYNSALTRSAPTELSVGRRYVVGAHVGGYALFGGGNYNQNSDRVDAYDASLTRTTPAAFTIVSYQPNAVSTESHAVFRIGTVINTYDASLTVTHAATLTQGSNNNQGSINNPTASVGDYVLFGTAAVMEACVFS